MTDRRFHEQSDLNMSVPASGVSRMDADDEKDKDHNVIMFPRERLDSAPPLNLADIRANLLAVREAHVFESLETLVQIFFTYMQTSGFDFSMEPELYSKDVALYVEAMKSMMMKHGGLPHPLQEVAETTFTAEESGHVRWTATGQIATEPAACEGDGG